MPISAERMKLYPGGSIRSPEWLAIREQVGQRSGWKCEACKAPHGEIVYRGKLDGRDVYMLEHGDTFDADTGEHIGCVHLYDLEPGSCLKIVLTVAHFDGDPTNNDLGNLRHWCQLHHNRHDAKDRAKNAATTRRGKSDQIDLVDWLVEDREGGEQQQRAEG